MSDEKNTYFVIKFALLSGKIERRDDLEPSDHDPKYLYGQWLDQFVFGVNAFLTIEQARLGAIVKREKKIASLKKQIAKLEKMSFEVPS